jgi:hypothetical protein
MFRSRWVKIIVSGSNTQLNQWITYGHYNVYSHSFSLSWTLMIVSAIYSWRLTFLALVYLDLFTTCRFSLYFSTPNNSTCLILVISRLSNEVSKTTSNWRGLVRYIYIYIYIYIYKVKKKNVLLEWGNTIRQIFSAVIWREYSCFRRIW